MGRIRIHLVIAVLCAAIFAGLAVGINTESVRELDESILMSLREMESEGMTSFLAFVTQAGSTAVFAAAAGLAAIWLVWRRRLLDTALVFASVLGAWLLNTLLKDLFARTRPDILHLAEADGYSFPSGNAMIGLAFYGLLTLLTLVSIRGHNAKTLVAVIGILLVLLVGLSRVYLGVHYPTDILAGYAAGGVWLSVCMAVRRIRASSDRTMRIQMGHRS